MEEAKLFLFIFEFLGTSELLIILIVALILFGPRKLPELSRSLGKSLSEFKRASEDFKRTWEREVELETFAKEVEETKAAILADDSSILPTGAERADAVEVAAEAEEAQPTAPEAAVANDPANTKAPDSLSRKRDWL